MMTYLITYLLIGSILWGALYFSEKEEHTDFECLISYLIHTLFWGPFYFSLIIGGSILCLLKDIIKTIKHI